MMRASLVLLSLLLVACGAPETPPAPSAAEDNVIGAPLEQSLDKARGVEDLSSERKEGLDDAVDAAN